MHKKPITACLALVAFVAMAALPALASASPVLKDKTGNVAVGGKILARNSGIVKITTADGTIECTDASMTGTVKKNNGTEIEGEISTASFNDTNASGQLVACSNPFFGDVTVTPKKFPWCIAAKNTFAADTFQLSSAGCPGGGAMEFTLDTVFAGECTYTKAAPVTGSFTTGTEAAPSVLSVSELEFKKAAGGMNCPPSGKLDMNFKMFTDEIGEPVVWIA
ncbi:MAG: hypothetical protein ACTHKT_09545 [Solirubrobacterales bacterium]